MNKHIKGFLLRGLVTMGWGPMIMAVIYGILYHNGVVETVSVPELIRIICTSALLAFIAAGITELYQIERLPLIAAIGIHGLALYLDYIIIYLVNGWLEKQGKPIAIFTVSFVLGFLLIWLFIWLFTRNKTKALNNKIHQQ